MHSDKILQFLNGPSFVWLWAAGLIAYTCFVAFVLILDSRKLEADLAKAVRYLREATDNRIFTKVNEEYLGSLDVISSAWRQFLQQLAIERAPDHANFLTFVEPGHFFNERTLIHPNLNRSSYRRVPFHLLSFGILGILVALIFSSSLQKTLPVAVVSVFGAIIFTMIDRDVFGNLHTLIEGWNQTIRSRVRFVSSEQILYDNLKMTRQQTSSLNQLHSTLTEYQNHNMADLKKILDSMVNTLGRTLKDALVPEIKAIQSHQPHSNHSNHSDGEHSGHLAKTYEKFAKSLEQFTSRSESLVKAEKESLHAVEKWDHISKTMLSTTEEQRKINEQLLKQWSSYCERFEGVDKSLAQAFSSTNDSINAYTERFKHVTQDLDKHLSKGLLSLAGSIGDLQQVLGNLPRQHQRHSSDGGGDTMQLNVEGIHKKNEWPPKKST